MIDVRTALTGTFGAFYEVFTSRTALRSFWHRAQIRQHLEAYVALLLHEESISYPHILSICDN